MLQISELKLSLDQDESQLKDLIASRIKTHNFSYEIIRKSLDARKQPVFSYCVKVLVDDDNKYLKYKNVTKYEEISPEIPHINSDLRPIVVGYGPSGIFATYYLFEAGLKPIVIEKGKRINLRKLDVEKYFNEGLFNKDSNVQFGEGGAGTFSDAKLTTRIKDPYITYILDTFIKFGANKEIKYQAHSHIGSDKIIDIISKITDYLMSNGVEFHFEETVKELVLDDKHNCIGVKTNKDVYYSPYTLLGIGHSAYELIKTVYNQGIYVEKKDIALGFRVEHPQSLLDDNQYHGLKHPKLYPSEYFLRYKGDKGVYSFCMCPGGFVIPANSDEYSICTNGMSNHKRDNLLANSAILVQINKEEFGEDALAGFDYIHEYEKKAYEYSNSYKALAMNIKDYINNQVNPLIFESSYPLGTVLCNFNDFLNKKDNAIIKEALLDFDKKIPGFIEQGIMVGPETRSSSPVRIKRDESLQSINTKGLYPMGEGAGYGGGIMSCGLDGIRIAKKVIEDLL